MDELIAFLNARLDEERLVAQEAANEGESRWRESDIAGWLPPIGAMGAYERQHIARHDPRRVLADVAAKRPIVAYAEDRLRSYIGTGAQVAFEWFTLRQLALPYADHPDYREEWRP